MRLVYEPTDCPVCGGREHSELADAEEVRREVEELWAFHLGRLRAGVPPERLEDRVAFSQHAPLRIVRCATCGTVFRNPRERAHVLTETYAEEAPDPRTLRALFETQRRSYRVQARRLARIVGHRGRGLEVGSYVGAFLAAARAEGWRFEGLDVAAASVRFARSLGLPARLGTIEDVPAGRRFDAVAIWNTFEQLPDPRRAAAAARRLLAPGGILALRVPSGAFYAALRPALDGPLRRAARALLAHNNLLGFPYRHGFTATSLERLLAGAGFRVVRRVGDTLVPLADEWTKPWAVWEERACKAALRRVARGAAAPWLEVYARAERPAGA
ncbi:MAG TPA: methyltransferase domain-containing protein [Longimicrobiales bacterium]|nr:methyltransferase domain-containing protein [Longimicrobiales bacterium]